MSASDLFPQLTKLSELHLDSSAILLLSVTILAFLIPIIIILPPVSPSTSDALLQTHNKAGMRSHKTAKKPASSNAQKVEALTIYPIQPCPGIAISRAKISREGLQHDGVFALAQLRSPFPLPGTAEKVSLEEDSSSGSEEDGKKPKQKTKPVPPDHSWEPIMPGQFPQLAHLGVDLWIPDAMKLRKQGLETAGANGGIDEEEDDGVFLVLRFPWQERGWRGSLAFLAAKLRAGLWAQAEKEILIPVAMPGEQDVDERGYVWENLEGLGCSNGSNGQRKGGMKVRALNMSRELPNELRLFLGVSNKLGLFRLDEKVKRNTEYPIDVQISGCSQVSPSGREAENEARPNIILSPSPSSRSQSKQPSSIMKLEPGTSNLHNPARFEVQCGPHAQQLRAKPRFSETGREKRRNDGDARKLEDRQVGLNGAIKLLEQRDDGETWVAVGMEVGA